MSDKQPSAADEFAAATKPKRIDSVIRSSDWRARRTLPTGIVGFDEHIGGGLKSRQLTVIPAPTGSGKTGFVGTIVVHLATTGHPVLWVLGEIDEPEQTARFAAIRMRQADGSTMTADQILGERSPSSRVVRSVEGLPIYLLNLDDASSDAFALIEEQARLIQEEHSEPPVIVIDYIQTIGDEAGDNLHASISGVAKRLRRLAKQLDAAIVGISSVSRAYYGIAGKTRKLKGGEKEHPRDWLAAAKESGDIEFAAGVVAYLDTSEEFDAVGEALARLIVAKSRQGTVGFVGLKFHGPTGLFTPHDASVRAMAPQEATPANDDETVACFIKRRCKAGKPPTRAELKSGLDGISHDRKRDALTRLLDDGVIEERAEDRRNATGATRKVSVLRWLGSDPSGDRDE